MDSVHRRQGTAAQRRRSDRCNVVPCQLRARTVRSSGLTRTSGATVVPLLHRCRPSAVLRTIRPIIIDAVQAVSFGTGSHVRDERPEVRAPTLAHGDSATAVVLVRRIRLQLAAATHVQPRAIEIVRRRTTVVCTSPGAEALRNGWKTDREYGTAALTVAWHAGPPAEAAVRVPLSTNGMMLLWP